MKKVSQMLKTRNKNRNNFIRGKNERQKFCFRLRKIQIVELVLPRANNEWRKAILTNCGTMST